jgi:hypothetical protein
MWSCLLATELARRAGLDAPDQRDVYYATLVRFARCAATSHETPPRSPATTSSSARAET